MYGFCAVYMPSICNWEGSRERGSLPWVSELLNYFADNVLKLVKLASPGGGPSGDFRYYYVECIYKYLNNYSMTSASMCIFAYVSHIPMTESFSV